MMTPTKVIRDGKVAVLVSRGWGAGWSSWESDQVTAAFLLFDAELVAMAEREASESEVEAWLRERGIESYTGGWEQVQIEWLDEGTHFLIDEYDGKESVKVRDNLSWFVA